jgi:hypothetical protein
VCGTIVVSEGNLSVPGLTARHHDATLEASAVCAWGNDTITATGFLRGKDIGFHEDLRQAVPWRWRKRWNDIEPEGTFDLELPEIRYARDGDEPGRWRITGSTTLKDIGGTFGVRTSAATGQVDGVLEINGPAPGVEFRGQLDLEHLAILDRELTSLTGDMYRSARYRELALDNLQGDIYGGLATGSALMSRHEDETSYNATALLRDVDLRSFVNAGRAEDKTPADMGGLLESRLYVSGIAGKTETRRGGGLVHVTQGRLFKVPLVASVADAANEGNIDDSAFHTLSGEFFLQGWQVQIEDLMLSGHSLAMMGSGTLELPHKHMNLIMISTGPRDWGRLPVLTELLEGTARELVEIHVFGPMEDPTIEARPFQGVFRTLEPLVQPKPPTTPVTDEQLKQR